MRFYHGILSILFWFGFAGPSIAEPKEQPDLEYYGEIGFGKADLKVDPASEADKQGHTYELGLSVMRHFAPLTLEAGLGYFSSDLKGDNDTYSGQRYRIQSAALNLGLWHRVTPHWYLGLSSRVVSGIESDFGPRDGAQKTTVLAAAEVLYRWKPVAPSWAVGLELQHDVTVKKRDYRAVLLSAGYFFAGAKPQVAPKPAPEPKKKEAAAVGPTGSLVLSVESDQGVPLIDVRYHILSGTRSVAQDVILKGGQKTFASFPKGIYEIEVAADGYRSERKMFIVPENQIAKLRIRLISLSEFEIEHSFDLGVINFEFAEATLTPDSLRNLDKVVLILNENQGLKKLFIGGHTDNVGTKEFNLTLSNNRAKAVVDYLVSKGVNPTRLEYRGYGQDVPIVSNETEEGRAKNRRVEFIVKELSE